MSKPFSRRNKAPVDAFRYDVPGTVKTRILATLSDAIKDFENQNRSARCMVLVRAMQEAIKAVYRSDGELSVPLYNMDEATASAYFLASKNDKSLDFLEHLVQCILPIYAEFTMMVINSIFDEEAIGYEIRRAPVGDDQPFSYPEFVHKDGKFIHEEIVRPCLEVLADAKFRTASDEMHDALKSYRSGAYNQAVTHAASAFESVLKTICTEKRWTYNADKDTLNPLVVACHREGLFPSFFTEIFKNVGTISNKISSSHGRGPAPEHVADKSSADHLIQLVATNINFLVKLAEF